MTERNTGESNFVSELITPVLTGCQQFSPRPLRLPRLERVIAAQLPIPLSVYPPPVPLFLGLPRWCFDLLERRLFEAGLVVLHLAGPLYLQHRNCVTSNRIRSVVSPSVMYTYYPKRHRWSGSSRSTTSSSPPRRSTCAKWIPTRSGNDVASLDHERLLSVWTSNAKQPSSYTRKMRTVKIAYRCLFFLFN